MIVAARVEGLLYLGQALQGARLVVDEGDVDGLGSEVSVLIRHSESDAVLLDLLKSWIHHHKVALQKLRARLRLFIFTLVSLVQLVELAQLPHLGHGWGLLKAWVHHHVVTLVHLQPRRNHHARKLHDGVHLEIRHLALIELGRWHAMALRLINHFISLRFPELLFAMGEVAGFSVLAITVSLKVAAELGFIQAGLAAKLTRFVGRSVNLVCVHLFSKLRFWHLHPPSAYLRKPLPPSHSSSHASLHTLVGVDLPLAIPGSAVLLVNADFGELRLSWRERIIGLA